MGPFGGTYETLRSGNSKQGKRNLFYLLSQVVAHKGTATACGNRAHLSFVSFFMGMSVIVREILGIEGNT